MIEVRYQPGITPMVFVRGPHAVVSAPCYVNRHGELRTLITDESLTSLVNQGYSLEVLLPFDIDCWF